MTGLGFTLLLSFLNEQLIELVYKPAREKLGDWSVIATPYIALATGAAMSLAFMVDLVTPFAAQAGLELVSPWPGRVVTALLVGGGSRLIHAVMDFIKESRSTSLVIETAKIGKAQGGE
ncbi:MAG: hypothetical protein GY943_22610 [Chloroflexi bacterium]|nr:hypothetical protein [Chloroflexota bacterium]